MNVGNETGTNVVRYLDDHVTQLPISAYLTQLTQLIQLDRARHLDLGRDRGPGQQQQRGEGGGEHPALVIPRPHRGAPHQTCGQISKLNKTGLRLIFFMNRI